MGLAIWARLQLRVARTCARWSARVVTTCAQGGLQLVHAADVRASTVVNAEAAAAPRGGAPLAGAPGAQGAPGRVASAHLALWHLRVRCCLTSIIVLCSNHIISAWLVFHRVTLLKLGNVISFSVLVVCLLCLPHMSHLKVSLPGLLFVTMVMVTATALALASALALALSLALALIVELLQSLPQRRSLVACCRSSTLKSAMMRLCMVDASAV